MIQVKIASKPFWYHSAKTNVLGCIFELGMAGSIPSAGGQTHAVETVKLIYKTDDVTVLLHQIRGFDATKQAPVQNEPFLLDGSGL